MSQTFSAGRFEVIDSIGEGREARVFRAMDHEQQRLVAVKLLHQTPADARGIEGVELLSARHPHLVEFIDVGVERDQAYVVQELVAGGALSDLPKPLPSQQVELLAEQMLSALGFLHAQGLLHGDVKPENILVVQGSTLAFKLADFGLARRRVDSATGVTRGTPAFMPPEIIRGEIEDERSDLYSLGVTLYEAMFGEVPFRHEDVQTVLKQHLSMVPPKLRNPGAADLKTVELLRRLLQKDPGRRPANAHAALSGWRGEELSMPRDLLADWGVLMGREAEMRQLEECFVGGTPVALVCGEPGVGKTRLLEEFILLRRLDRTRVISCSEDDLLLRTEGSGSPGAQAGLPGSLQDLGVRLDDGDCVVLVDDIRSLDSRVAESLAAMMREFSGADRKRSLLLLASRENLEAFSERHLAALGLPLPAKIDLQPWQRDELGEAAAALFGVQKLDAGLIDFLMKTTGGVPLAVYWACRSLLDRRHVRLESDGVLTLYGSGHDDDFDVDWLQSSLQNLDNSSSDVLRTLCLMDRPLSSMALEELSGRDPEPALQHLRMNGFVRSVANGDAIMHRCSHESVRKAVEKQMSNAEVAQRHDRIAEWFDARKATSGETSLLYHQALGSDWRQGYAAALRLDGEGRLGPSKLRKLYEALAARWPENEASDERAQLRCKQVETMYFLGAYEEGAHLAAEALSWAPAGEARQRLVNLQARSLQVACRYEDMLALLERPEGKEARWEAELLRAEGLEAMGRAKEAMQICEYLAAEVPEDSVMADAILIRRLETLRFLNGWEEIQSLAQEILQRERQATARLRGHAHHYLTAVAIHEGRMLDAEKLSRLAYEDFREIDSWEGIGRALSGRSIAAAELGKFSEAERLLRRSIAMQQKAGMLSSLEHSITNLGQLLSVLGRMAEALDTVKKGIEICVRGGAKNQEIASRIIAAGIHARLGAGAHVEEQLRHLDTADLSSTDRAKVLMIRAEMGINLGDLQQAGTQLDEAEALLRRENVRDEIARCQILRARWYHLTEQPAHVLEQLDEAGATAAEIKIPDLVLDIEVCRAEFTMGNGPPGLASRVDQALSVARKLELRGSLWRLERIAGRLALRDGRRRQALEHYRQAGQTLREMLHGLPRALSEAYLAQHGVQEALAEMKALR